MCGDHRATDRQHRDTATLYNSNNIEDITTKTKVTKKQKHGWDGPKMRLIRMESGIIVFFVFVCLVGLVK